MGNFDCEQPLYCHLLSCLLTSLIVCFLACLLAYLLILHQHQHTSLASPKCPQDYPLARPTIPQLSLLQQLTKLLLSLGVGVAQWAIIMVHSTLSK